MTECTYCRKGVSLVDLLDVAPDAARLARVMSGRYHVECFARAVCDMERVMGELAKWEEQQARTRPPSTLDEKVRRAERALERVLRAKPSSPAAYDYLAQSAALRRSNDERVLQAYRDLAIDVSEFRRRA